MVRQNLKNEKIQPLNKDKNTLLIVGGGRWARQYLICLSGILADQLEVQILTENNRAIVEETIRRFPNRNRFSIIENLGEVEYKKILIAFVVNKSSQHNNAVRYLLRKQVNVLSEKPMTLKLEDSISLINFASKHKTLLFSSNILLYSNSLNIFSKSLSDLNDISEINIKWHDGINEIRYGENKIIDKDISVLNDVAPHIVCMLMLILNQQLYFSNIQVTYYQNREIHIKLLIGKVQVNLDLNQSAKKRKRFIEISYDGRLKLRSSLDFTSELAPKIFLDNDSLNLVLSSPKSISPLESMLLSAIDCARYKMHDSRLTTLTEVTSQLLQQKILESILKV